MSADDLLYDFCKSTHLNFPQFTKWLWLDIQTSPTKGYYYVRKAQTTGPCDAKAWSLCTGAESNLGDRVLGEVEKYSFIASPGKGGQSGLMPSKLRVPTLGRWGGEGV